VRVREALREHRAQILETESLARLREDAPISNPAEATELWAVPKPDALRALGKLFDELEFKSLQARLAKLID
jgi:hypothetical protein